MILSIYSSLCGLLWKIVISPQVLQGSPWLRVNTVTKGNGFSPVEASAEPQRLV